MLTYYAGQSDEALPDISRVTLNSAEDGPGQAADAVDVDDGDNEGAVVLRGLLIACVVLCVCVCVCLCVCMCLCCLCVLGLVGGLRVSWGVGW